MNLRDLSYLVALADHRHFGRAAEASFVSQPTLSTQIRKLERELGVELVERNPRNVLLTHAGAQVVERARVLLREADDIRAIAKRAQDPESGSLRLGIFPTLGPYLLPHVIPLVHERFPNLELLLVEDKTEAILTGLRDGTLDAAVLAQPVADNGLRHEMLFSEDFVLAVPARSELAQDRDPVDMGELADLDLLLLEEGHCLRDQALAVCRLSGAGERRGFRATSLETLRQMVGAGVGATLLPTLAVAPPVPPFDDVVLRRFAAPAPHRDVALFWRETSVYHDLMPELARLLRSLPTDLVTPHQPD